MNIKYVVGFRRGAEVSYLGPSGMIEVFVFREAELFDDFDKAHKAMEEYLDGERSEQLTTWIEPTSVQEDE